MKFTVSDQLLREMFSLSSFPVPDAQLVFVGLRGCLPILFGGGKFQQEEDLLQTPLDYLHMRCTIVQWDTGTRTVAAFPGSTIPHLSGIQDSLKKNGKDTNRLSTGFYGALPKMPDQRYKRGHHGPDKHLAFRNESRLPVLRTADDTDYDGLDRLEYGAVLDNLHAARNANESVPFYSSNGCVVICGTPGTKWASGLTKETGPWRAFLVNAYGREQTAYALALFEQGEALRTYSAGAGQRAPTVRFGSRGELVEQLQNGLIAKGLSVGAGADGLFGHATLQALRAFQLKEFGASGVDMIAGPGTARALGIDWPNTAGPWLKELTASPLAPAEDHDIPNAAAEIEALAPQDGALSQDDSLPIALDTRHAPLPDWKIAKGPADTKGNATWTLAYQGQPPLYLGRFTQYDGYATGPTRGLSRNAAAKPGIAFDPGDWTEFGFWPELLFPTAMAESAAQFCVINAYDRAAITLGFIQLAAHTGEDLLPSFRLLWRELPDEAAQWFPELRLVEGALCFVKGNKFRSLERPSKPHDGGFSAHYYRGDLMAFFNPDRYHNDGKPIDPAELHASARWLAWTLTSPRMRRLQVLSAIDNMKLSVNILHKAMQADAAVRAKYPAGVDGMRCDLLSVGLSLIHLSDGNRTKVISALKTDDPIETLRTLDYSPRNRARDVHFGMTKRPMLRQLRYDLKSHKPI